MIRCGVYCRESFCKSSERTSPMGQAHAWLRENPVPGPVTDTSRSDGTASTVTEAELVIGDSDSDISESSSDDVALDAVEKANELLEDLEKIDNTADEYDNLRREKGWDSVVGTRTFIEQHRPWYGTVAYRCFHRAYQIWMKLGTPSDSVHADHPPFEHVMRILEDIEEIVRLNSMPLQLATVAKHKLPENLAEGVDIDQVNEGLSSRGLKPDPGVAPTAQRPKPRKPRTKPSVTGVKNPTGPSPRARGGPIADATAEGARFTGYHLRSRQVVPRLNLLAIHGPEEDEFKTLRDRLIQVGSDRSARGDRSAGPRYAFVLRVRGRRAQTRRQDARARLASDAHLRRVQRIVSSEPLASRLRPGKKCTCACDPGGGVQRV